MYLPLKQVKRVLLPKLKMKSIDEHEPIVVYEVPEPWKLLGTGNYAAVFTHPDAPDVVVKVYAKGRPGFADEKKVYQQIGQHPAYSECYYAETPYLILKRIRGITFYDCIHQGIRIPEQAITDIDEALAYAVSRGLRPHDIHGKNIMLVDGRGVIVDVSDFLKYEPCSMWDDLKRAYHTFYRPLLYRHPIPIPKMLLEWIRKGYRYFRRSDNDS